MNFIQAAQMLADAPESMREALIGLITMMGLQWLMETGWVKFLIWFATHLAS